MNELYPVIAAIASGLLLPIVGALGLWGAGQVKKMQAKSNLKTLKENALSAVQYVEQIYADFPGDEKKEMAISLATKLNAIAGITADKQTQVVLNEASVLTLPETKKEEACG